MPHWSIQRAESLQRTDHRNRSGIGPSAGPTPHTAAPLHEVLPLGSCGDFALGRIRCDTVTEDEDECAQHDRREPLPSDRTCHELRHRNERVDPDLWIDGLDEAMNRRHDGCR